MSSLEEILSRLADRGQDGLTDLEGFALLDNLGYEVPVTVAFDTATSLSGEDLGCLGGSKVVLKAVVPQLSHKTEVGGVRVLRRDLEEITAAAREMADRLRPRGLQGFYLQEWIDYDREPGNELLLGLRWDREFGPVVTCGLGGVHAEALTGDLEQERALCVARAGEWVGTRPLDRLAEITAIRLMTSRQRGRQPRLPLSTVLDAIRRLANRAGELIEAGVAEIEINPLVVHGGRLVPLDVLVRWASDRSQPRSPRPRQKVANLLEPKSIAVVGVSRALNPGRIILRNIVRAGFDRQRVLVIKPGESEIEGCRCVAQIEDLEERFDLLVVAVGADQVPDLLSRVCEGRLAESLIVIPGGLDEREGSGDIAGRLSSILDRARETDWQGPIVNGGNCMGIVSAPGRYDTFFLPEHKLTVAGETTARTALVCQSGAFLAARTSKLASLPLRYAISIGNQVDLTLGDYLTYLAEDESLDVVGVYVEGFKDLDGCEFLSAVTKMRQRGKAVVLYRAGRSPEGASAAASHTASMAGSYLTTIGLARGAGALIAETLDDFDDLVALATRMAGRRWTGRRLVGLSNAGFECVALSDRLGWFEAVVLEESTRGKLKAIFEQAGILDLVEARNPLDVTPMVGDELFCRCVETLLADPGAGVGVVGCVPLTGALQTLPVEASHAEDLDAPEAIVRRLSSLWESTTLPWVTVVDGGANYDPMADALGQAGIPTFRSMDRAMRLLEIYGRWADTPFVAEAAGEA